MSEEEQLVIFKSWLEKYKALLLKVVRAYAFTAMDRDDLFQDISVQVWRSIPSFRKESAPITWLYRVALNTAISWSKRERRRADSAQTLDNDLHVLHEEKQEQDDRLRWLYDEIGRLDEVDRSLALLMLDDLSYEQMSVILGISQSNVGVRINRLKKHLVSRSKLFNNGI